MEGKSASPVNTQGSRGEKHGAVHQVKKQELGEPKRVQSEDYELANIRKAVDHAAERLDRKSRQVDDQVDDCEPAGIAVKCQEPQRGGCGHEHGDEPDEGCRACGG